MPGIPLVAREAIQSRNGDQSCRQDSRVHLSAEEELDAEESLSAYCKPVELYNILQRRAMRNPLFLQRCLHYKVQARHQKRIQMTVSLSGTSDDGLQMQSMCPMYIMLARLLSDIPDVEHSAVYRYTKAHLLTAPSTEEGGNVAQANFILPEMNKLVREAKSGSFFILFVSYAGAFASSGIDTSGEHSDSLSLSTSVEKSCLWGKISMESLFLSWEKFPNLNMGERIEMLSTVDLHPCLLKSGFLGKEKCISFQMPKNSSHMHLPVVISAEERGAKEKSPYSPCTYNNVPDSSSRVLGLRTGNVIFNYRYYHNKLQRTEVTEDFSCPFCLVKCASFKGLKLHLVSSHDLFNFEFWVTEEYQAVNVSVKNDPRSSESVAASDLLNKADDAYSSRIERARSSSVNESLNAIPDPDCIQSMSGGSLAPPAMLQFAKSRKLSIERSDFRSRALLEKRQFFHSHRAQPMTLEQVLSDHDSEDEVDDDVADLEDRRMLDDFVDVSKDEKQIMHLWNSFVRKQRILADGHIPWACEAFSRLHGHNLVQAPALIWCWRLFMIKLWNHGLLDARTMNNCSLILGQCQKQDTTYVKAPQGSVV